MTHLSLPWIALTVLAALLTIFATVCFFGVRIMATLAQVNASLAEQTQAIRDLENAMPGPPAATEADLEGVNKGIQDNTSEIRRLAQEAPGGGKP